MLGQNTKATPLTMPSHRAVRCRAVTYKTTEGSRRFLAVLSDEAAGSRLAQMGVGLH